MKLRSTRILAIGASLLLAFPAFAQANNNSSNTSSGQASAEMGQSSPRGRMEAEQMVPASVVLVQGIDAKKMQPGADFKAELNGKIHLTNGTELPSGTIFEGTVASDDMNMQGSSKLALRFTKADPKDGASVPIKATIIAVYTPEDQTAYSENDGSSVSEAVPNNWNDGTLAVDQLGVTSGVDMHSKVSSMNSGVFVSTTKDDVKLRRGSDLSLAVAPANRNQQNSSQMNSAGQPSGD